MSANTPDPATVLQRLAPRERDLLELIAQGRSYRQIGQRFNLHHRSVRNLASHLYQTLRVPGRTEAAVWVWKNGLVGKIAPQVLAEGGGTQTNSSS